MQTKLYIAYGSNMDTKQMAQRCPEAKVIGVSEIVGYQLLFKGSPTGVYATIEKAEGEKVPVLVWEISTSDEQRLDRYEEFPELYYKDILILLVNGLPEKAMVYIMDERKSLGRPSSRYYKVLEKAYKKFDFEQSILEKALVICKV